MDRPKVGLALSGGGAKGFVHLGVIKVLERHKIPIDVVTGTSIGSLFGAAYASGTPVRKIVSIMNEENTRKNFRKYMFDPTLKGGLLKGEKVLDLIDKLLTEKRIEKFPIRFGCPAVDIRTGKVHNFTKGDAAHAVRASGSYPGLFKPLKYKKMLLVDGGLLANIPITLAKDLGAEILLVSKVYSRNPRNKKLSPIEVINSSFTTMQREIEERTLEENPDAIVVRTYVGKKVSTFGFGNKELANSLIKRGEDSAKKKMDEIKALLCQLKD